MSVCARLCSTLVFNFILLQCAMALCHQGAHNNCRHCSTNRIQLFFLQGYKNTVSIRCPGRPNNGTRLLCVYVCMCAHGRVFWRHFSFFQILHSFVEILFKIFNFKLIKKTKNHSCFVLTCFVDMFLKNER